MKNDLLAKLLASENINIVKAPVSTASFDLVHRTVTIPNWQDMTPEIELMLIAHETSHALFTPIELVTDESPSPHSYRNCIEDVRVEQKIKKLFPGLRKDFTSGYQQLNDRNFFGIQNKDLSKLTLIDKINIYFKVGASSGVKFTTDEFVFIERSKTCDTYKDVIKLADDIFAFAKELKDAKKEHTSIVMEEEEAFGDRDDSDKEDSDEDLEDEDLEDEEDYSDTPDDSDQDLEPTTQDAFDKNLSETADVNTVFINHETNFSYKDYDPIVDYKTIIEDLTRERREYGCGDIITQAKKFKDESIGCVNYLVKEFEMKKSASRYSRSMTAKSGTLNLNRLHAHSISDNLFKKVTVVPDDKNHGMIFLLDWSGSMYDVMDDTIKQVINLAMFCQRSSISYQVFAFTSRSIHRSDAPNTNSITHENFNLLELFSNKMSTKDFNAMIGLLLSKPWNYAPGFGLGHTPLNSSLIYMIDYIGKFTKQNNVEKVSLITLTDGGSDRLNFTDSPQGHKSNHRLRDTITKKTYSLNYDPLEQTQTLIKLIKDRYDIPVIGFTITGTSRKQLQDLLVYGLGYQYGMCPVRDEMELEIKTALRKSSAYIITHTQYDELYIISKDIKITNEELKADGNMSASVLSKNFSKFLNKKKTSRVVLEKFIHIIS